MYHTSVSVAHDVMTLHFVLHMMSWRNI